MIDLKARYGSEFKVTLDQSAEILGQTTEDRAWLQIIPGKLGHVFIQGVDTLGAYVRTSYDSTNRLGRLLALPGAKLLARGDQEASVSFDPANLPEVAEILRLKRRRKVSDEQKRKFLEATAPYRFAPRH